MFFGKGEEIMRNQEERMITEEYLDSLLNGATKGKHGVNPLWVNVVFTRLPKAITYEQIENLIKALLLDDPVDEGIGWNRALYELQDQLNDLLAIP
jgi:hypothetical protein